MEKQKRGRPKGSGQVINYAKVKLLGRYQGLQKDIAAEIGISEEDFCRKLSSNSALKEALEGGRSSGRLQASKTLFEAMADHYFTFCQNPDCCQIQDHPFVFFPKCPVCDSMGEDGDGNPKYYPVKHKREPGDREIIKFFAKNFLGMSDKVTVQGDSDRPIVFSTLAEFAMHQARKHGQKAEKNL
jgi:hypothetical protein